MSALHQAGNDAVSPLPAVHLSSSTLENRTTMIFQKFLQTEKWQHKDPAVRLEAVSELAQATDLEAADLDKASLIIIDLARLDSDESVRVAAIAQLRSAEVLQELSASPADAVRLAAITQLRRLVSGSAPSALTAEQRLAMMQENADREALLQIVLDCGCDDIGLATLHRLRDEFALDESQLADIAAQSNNHTVRYAAAQHIENTELLEAVANQARHRDKSVFRHCREKLQAREEEDARKAVAAARSRQICEAVEALAVKPILPLTLAQLDYKTSRWQEVCAEADESLQQRFNAASETLRERLAEHAANKQALALQRQQFDSIASACANATATLSALRAPLTTEQVEELQQQVDAIKALMTEQQQDPSQLLDHCRQTIATAERSISAFNALEAKAEDLAALATEIGTLTAKGTVALRRVQQEFDQLLDKASWPHALPHSALFIQSLETGQQLQRLLERNRTYLDKLHAESLAHIEAMQQHIEQGQVNDAQRLWDKVQGAIRNADEALAAELQEKVNPHRAGISELMAWKNFAANEKKKELIEQMQALIDGEMHAAEQAKRIKALQEEWKTLGHSLHNDTLWQQFNELAHKAFEPCKEYFRERKAKLQANLEVRNRICTELEALLPTLTTETVNLTELNKIESKALEDWKLHAPVEQARIKKLQKRFNTVLSDLRQFKRKTLQANAARKLALIAQAEQLDSLEDVGEAMSEAKKLQAEWKTIGPSPYKDDRNHWNAFRAACDKLFNKRSKEAPRARPTSARQPGSGTANPAVAVAREALRKISDLLMLSSEELVQSRKQFNELTEEFSTALSADLKHEKRALQDQFNRLSKSFESRLRDAPDKKTLQLVDHVRTKAEFCAKLEQDALAGTTIDDHDALAEQWQALGRLSDLMQEQALEQRFHALTQGVEARLLKKQARDNEEKAREICIAAEINAALDSPPEDKALRMTVQLKQLKNSFGKTSKSGAQLVNELELQLLCLGPLDAASRSSFEQRLGTAKGKV